MERESFGSRIGFILISAGCAIGLGNVWRFPYIVGQYGGAIFILIYLLFLLIFGLPIMAMEFSVGRASRLSIASSFKSLEPKGTKWHWFGIFGMAGNYLLMMFYTVISGWMVAYLVKSIKGDFSGLSPEGVSAEFASFTGSAPNVVFFMILVVALGFLVCSLGLKKGVEKITKVMMVALLGIIAVLAIRSITLEGGGEGLRYYLVPSLKKMSSYNLGEVIFAALGQAFFTLSIGIGSMAIFGTYINKDRRLMGETISIALLDTFVAFVAGLIIFPSCSAYGVKYAQGPGLIFETLPNVFNSMPLGRLWGSLFFLFMVFAAMSTVVAVFENIVSFAMDLWKWSRKKACIVNVFAVIILSVPCALGFNIWSGIQPIGAGSTILDIEDFIVSNNLLPLGSLVYVCFCTWNKKGWGWNNFLEEANTGKGIKYPSKLYFYAKYIMPVILLVFWVHGYISKFFPTFYTDVYNFFVNMF
ncbi:MAG: sodium-dependent transporter [Clostridia bacterium]|nr:sodium-dependent transporter [Clostridia bacterium]